VHHHVIRKGPALAKAPYSAAKHPHHLLPVIAIVDQPSPGVSQDPLQRLRMKGGVTCRSTGKGSYSRSNRNIND
jgi:hypothetical protein